MAEEFENLELKDENTGEVETFTPVDVTAREQIESLNETLTEYYAMAGFQGVATSNQYFKVCSCTLNRSNGSAFIKLMVSPHFANAERQGILTVYFKTNSSGALNTGSTYLRWDYAGSDIALSDFNLVVSSDGNGLTATLYIKVSVDYLVYFFDVLSEGDDTSLVQSLWTIYKNRADGDYSELPDGTVIQSTLATLQNPTVNTTSISALSDNSRIVALESSIDELTDKLTAIEHKLDLYRAYDSQT